MAISSDVIRGYNDTMILYLLLDQPSYGYEISRADPKRSPMKNIFIKETTLSSVYTYGEKWLYHIFSASEHCNRQTHYLLPDHWQRACLLSGKM